jgi:hypothetical protein
MKTRHDPITGNGHFSTISSYPYSTYTTCLGEFHIDPDLDTVALDKDGVTTVDRRHYNQRHMQKHRHHGRRGCRKRAELPTPNAIFETRRGAIALDLAVVPGVKHWHSRALVQAATRHGSVDINVVRIRL